MKKLFDFSEKEVTFWCLFVIKQLYNKIMFVLCDGVLLGLSWEL